MSSKTLHPLMLAGTGSDVGKSVLATALCRIFLQDGYHPAPFKAQNMALNSFATPDGLEIGRAQAVQAEAAGLPCHTDMNPLLLKPQSDHTSQVVLNGRPIGNTKAYDFWRPEKERLRAEVCAAYDRLAARYNPIVMEGAGSICELNLRDHDLVNMPMARHAGADVILVGDIDRGGIFASVYGSIVLQEPEDRQRIKGIIVNKFRGDLRLFDEGRRMLEDICGVPVLGVIPYYQDIHIEGEDSVALEKKAKTASPSAARVLVAVVHLRHISNYTDFDALEQDPRVELYYTDNPSELAKANIIILPGTKATLTDLLELHRNGCAEAIVRAYDEGKTVLGICGGYQMMGEEVLDPDRMEGGLDQMTGLGLLPVSTIMSHKKRTRQVTFTPYVTAVSAPLSAYEIHIGGTLPVIGAPHRPFALLDDGGFDGYVDGPTCMGTYLHGVLDSWEMREFLLAPYLHDGEQVESPVFDYQQFKEQQYDRLADHVRQHLDMERLYQILTDHD